MIFRKKKIGLLAEGLSEKERERLEECAQALKEFLPLWLKFYWQIRKAYQGSKADSEKEFQFLQLKSKLAHDHQYLYDYLDSEYLGGQVATDFLRGVVSMSKIAATKSDNYYKIEKEWHVIYLRLFDSLTQIQFRLEQEEKQK